MKGFTEFSVKNTSVRLNSDDENEEFIRIGCVGTVVQTLNTKTITKKCEGVITKKVTKHAGDGELKMTLHMQWSVYKKLYGMNSSKLKEGVIGYGCGTHPEFTTVMESLNEDDAVKYKAYPKCVITDGPSPNIDNGSEEVAEIEVTIGLSADDNGFCLYEALESELKDDTVKDEWMKNFSPDLVLQTEETV